MAIQNKKEEIIFYSIQGESLKKLHIYEGGVSAGFPSPADDYLDVDLNLHKYLVKHPAATFFIIAKGHSMEKAGISDNDLLVIDKSLEPKNNDIVVAAVNGEFGDYPDIEITKSIEFEVWGVVTHTIHNHR